MGGAIEHATYNALEDERNEAELEHWRCRGGDYINLNLWTLIGLNIVLKVIKTNDKVHLSICVFDDDFDSCDYIVALYPI